MRRITKTSVALFAGIALLMATPLVAESAAVDINSASTAQLATIKGIGSAKARAIIDYREMHGKFQSVDDLKMVRGIGDKMLERMRSQLTVGGGGSAPPLTDQ